MAQSLPCIINQLCFTFPTKEQALFSQINFALKQPKTALVGRNGSGKSTLLKLIYGELQPTSGSIITSGTIAYCPQQLTTLNQTVARVLGIEKQVLALERIKAGSVCEHDFLCVGDDWLIAQHAQNFLENFALQHLSLLNPIANLSGGEQTRLLLANTFAHHPSLILLDEPTNNLDSDAKQLLFSAIRNCPGHLLIVSHDRDLLNLMDEIIELKPPSVKVFGGNYDFYMQQKILHEQALQQDLKQAKQHLVNTKKSIQQSKEKHAERAANGERLRKSNSQSPLLLDKMKDSSTKHLGQLTIRHEHMLTKANNKLSAAKAQIEVHEPMHFSLMTMPVPKNKMIITMEDVSYDYQQNNIIHHCNLILTGTKRIALLGANGSGKTTLIKLMLGLITPQQGHVLRGTDAIFYIDQHAQSLNPNESVLDNFLRCNPHDNINSAHAKLANFLFRATDAHKPVHTLSGGEKIRAQLACILMRNTPPQLLILDEPTNHLDLDSVKTIEDALCAYQGMLIVVAHEHYFLRKINIQFKLQAPFNRQTILSSYP